MTEFERDATPTGKIISTCLVCGSRSMAKPNKGLGRADLAAWESRHTCKAERRSA